MPPLTWRNVDAPSFTGSLDGLRTASTMLGNATRSGIDMIDTFKQTNEEAADRAILNRAMAIDDPAAYAAAKANGTLVGGDLPNASLATLRELDKRPDMLLNRAVTQQNLDQTGWVNNRIRDRDARWTAAAPDIALANVLARDNNQADLTKLLSTSAALRALDPDQLAGVFTGADTLTNSAQTRRDWDTKARIAADGETGQQEWNTISRDNATLGDVQQAVNARASSLTPGAYANLVNRARAAGYNVNAPIGDANSITTPSSPSSGFSGSTGSPILSGSSPALSIMTGGAALPDTIKTVGDLVDNKSALLKTNPKGTATGLWQITADTWAQFAPAALGQGWKSADVRDPQVQSKVGEAIWNSAKNDPKKIQGRWASVNAQEAESMQGKTWAEVQDILSRKESGVAASSLAAAPQEATSGVKSTKAVDPAAQLLSQVRGNAGLGLGTEIVQQQIRERAGQNQVGSIFPNLEALQASNKKAVEVVDELIREGGALAGANKAEVLDYINWIVENSKNRISPSLAGEMLARNLQGSDNWAVRAGTMLWDVIAAPFGGKVTTGNLTHGPNGIRLNDEGVYQMMDQYLTGATSTQLAAQKTLGTESEVITGLQNRYNEADALYKQMLAQSKSRPGVAKNLDVYKQKRDAAEQALSRALQSVPNQDTLVPSFDRPVATTRPSRTGSW